MSRTVVKYSDIAIGAKERFTPETADIAEFSDLSALNTASVALRNVTNACEDYALVLDGKAQAIPSSGNVGYWSEQITDGSGAFASPIAIVFEAEEAYTSSGITLTFDEHNAVYPTEVGITWEDASGIILQKLFYPDSPVYFCEKLVENFTKITIAFFSLNAPYSALKIRGIDYGGGYTFGGDELLNVSVVQSHNSISAELPISTAEITLRTDRGEELTFQDQQPITITYDGRTIATRFITDARRTAKNAWNISAEDYIGLLDGIEFAGDIYNDVAAYDLFNQISEVSGVPFEIDASFHGVMLSGHIPFTTCRNALTQVAFASCAAVITADSDRVKVLPISSEVVQHIPLDRVLQGQATSEQSKVTGVAVTAHTYEENRDELIILYDNISQGIDPVGEGILVKFSQPIGYLAITFGEIISRTANSAVINAREGCLMAGCPYKHYTKRKTKSDESRVQNIKEISGATLVSPKNLDKVLEACYNYYTKNRGVSARIFEGRDDEGNVDAPSSVGEIVSIETPYSGDIVCRIEKQSFKLNSGTVVKDTTAKEI